MTQEDKELLLKDLCARLPYGVIVDYKEDKYDFHHWKISTLHAPAYSQSGSLISTDLDGWIGYEEYKGCGMSTGSRPLHIEITLPFLRPMSSMTEEEFTELKNYTELKYDQLELVDWDNTHRTIEFYLEEIPHYCVIKVFDWLNAHHFDYRGLIRKGLALEATEGMYDN